MYLLRVPFIAAVAKLEDGDCFKPSTEFVN